MSHAFRVFLVTSMLVGIASAHAGEALRSPEPKGISENGLSVNGFRKNGMSLNRLAFNGTQARTQLSGIALDRIGVR